MRGHAARLGWFLLDWHADCGMFPPLWMVLLTLRLSGIPYDEAEMRRVHADLRGSR